jgi:hypothetical protein
MALRVNPAPAEPYFASLRMSAIWVGAQLPPRAVGTALGTVGMAPEVSRASRGKSEIVAIANSNFGAGIERHGHVAG